MELSKLNENLNNIQSLPDKPTLTGEELKQEFDKAANVIKEYLNGILTEELISILTELERGVLTGDSAINTINGIISEMKSKLDSVETGANKYTHPSGAGNKHIPSGGSSGQILRWSAAGTAAWGADNNTTYSAATTSKTGLMSSTDKTKLDGIATGATRVVVSRGTSAPSGGSNGNIYIQYF